MTARALTPGIAQGVPRSSWRRPGSGARRRRLVALELAGAVAICFAGYAFGARWLQVVEARLVVSSLQLSGRDDVSGALPGHILIFDRDDVWLNAEVTASCSSALSIVGLTALTFTVFRGRRQHALAGLLAAVVVLVALNWVRLVASTLAGMAWGRPAMVLFHDWVGSLWNFVATFIGFLVLVAVTLPAPERAEQDSAGRHTARRPDSWARPGLGYQAPLDGAGTGRRTRNITALVHRYVLPRRVSAHLARRREAARIDYRIGHLTREGRIAKIRELAADGLGAHTASLLAVATYEHDPGVLDVLAAEVAARQWEPVTTSRLLSLRLWARGWSMSRSLPPSLPPDDVPPGDDAGTEDDDTHPLGSLLIGLRPVTPVPAFRPRRAPPMTPRPRHAAPIGSERPRSFARPSSVPDPPHPEDFR